MLIGDLHGAGVAGIEYIQVARALDGASDTSLALVYYNDAVSARRMTCPRAPLRCVMNQLSTIHWDRMLLPTRT